MDVSNYHKQLRKAYYHCTFLRPELEYRVLCQWGPFMDDIPYFCGLEKEMLRITKDGLIATSPHPFSDPINNPYITLDFARNQLELVSPKQSSNTKTLECMTDLIQYTYANLDKKEMLWPSSMPPPFDPQTVEVAQFGSSPDAKVKELYRKGLRSRYGLYKMLITGFHYNFSLAPEYWSMDDRFSHPFEGYLHILRNALRNMWIFPYLFGASPLGLSNTHNPMATSLRLSPQGYWGPVQDLLPLKFNSPKEHIESLYECSITPYGPFQDFPEQLNGNMLQNENELYLPVQLKVVPEPGRSRLDKMAKEGPDYMELRLFDLNPLYPLGISLEELEFGRRFLLHMLTLESPPFREGEYNECLQNLFNVSLYGQDPKLTLTISHNTQSFSLSARVLLENMGAHEQLGKLVSVKNIPSWQIARHPFMSFNLEKARTQSEHFHKKDIPEEAYDSFERHGDTFSPADFPLAGYEDLELSTQILIKQALRQKIQVEVLDSYKSILRLTQGDHTEYVQQATITSLDSYVTVQLKENKTVSKKLLTETGLVCPKGQAFVSILDAREYYSQWANKTCIVKPNATNYGLGVHFLHKPSEEEFLQAVETVLSFGERAVVEDYVEGSEYRILVMKDRVVAALRRDPANIIGDGQRTIQELIENKNHDPVHPRIPLYYLRMGETEQQLLEKQDLSFDSIPPAGQQVWLRQTSNVSTGGDTVDVTEKIHPGYKTIAIQAAKSVFSQVCGIDVIIQGDPTQFMESNYAILEVNYNPALHIHALPNKGQSRNVAKALLRLLGFKES